MRRILPYLFLLLLTATSCVDNDTYDDNPQGNLEALWRILDEHYCFFEEKGVDWNAVHEKYAVRMNAEMSESQQFEVMTQMISELRDGHVNLYTTFNTGRYWSWKEDYPTNFSDTLLRRYLRTDYLIAGGTDVLIKLREFEGFSRLVDIHDLPELKPITREADGTVRVGSGASFTDLEESPIIRECIPMLGESAASVAGPQIRNMGTIGGNLCNGAVSADTCAPVLALNGYLNIRGAEGERTIPALGFHTGPGRVALKRDEVLLSVEFRPEDWLGWGAAYHKYAMREAMDIATIGCAAAVRLDV